MYIQFKIWCNIITSTCEIGDASYVEYEWAGDVLGIDDMLSADDTLRAGDALGAGILLAIFIKIAGGVAGGGGGGGGVGCWNGWIGSGVGTLKCVGKTAPPNIIRLISNCCMNNTFSKGKKMK